MRHALRSFFEPDCLSGRSDGLPYSNTHRTAGAGRDTAHKAVRFNEQSSKIPDSHVDGVMSAKWKMRPPFSLRININTTVPSKTHTTKPVEAPRRSEGREYFSRARVDCATRVLMCGFLCRGASNHPTPPVAVHHRLRHAHSPISRRDAPRLPVRDLLLIDITAGCCGGLGEITRDCVPDYELTCPSTRGHHRPRAPPSRCSARGT